MSKVEKVLSGRTEFFFFLGMLTLISCAKAPVAPNIPYLDSWQGKEITVCCDRKKDRICSSEHWTNVIHEHCLGRAKSQGEAQNPNRDLKCVRYSCDGKLEPTTTKNCSPNGKRVVQVHFVVDPSFKAEVGQDWQGRLRRAVSNLNYGFRNVGIEFRILNWTDALLTKSGVQPNQIFAELRKHKIKSKADLHFAVVDTKRTSMGMGKYLLGLSPFLGDEVMLNLWAPEQLGRLIIHEVGHIFGAVHDVERTKIMHVEFLGDGRDPEFGETSKTIFRMTRCLDMKKGPDGLTPIQRKLLLDVYDAVVKKPIPNPIAFAYFNKAADPWRNKDFDEAERLLRLAVKAQSSDPLYQFNLAKLMFEQRKFVEAEREFRKAVVLGEKLPKYTIFITTKALKEVAVKTYAKSALADTLFRLNRKKEAKALAVEAAGDNPEFYYPHFWLAVMAYDEGDNEEGKRHLDKARALHPDWHLLQKMDEKFTNRKVGNP